MRDDRKNCFHSVTFTFKFGRAPSFSCEILASYYTSLTSTRECRFIRHLDSNGKTLASQMALVVKNLPANAGDARDLGSISGSGRSPAVGNDTLYQNSCLENSWKIHGQRSLADYSSWGLRELDMTEHTHTQLITVAKLYLTKRPVK